MIQFLFVIAIAFTLVGLSKSNLFPVQRRHTASFAEQALEEQWKQQEAASRMYSASEYCSQEDLMLLCELLGEDEDEVSTEALPFLLPETFMTCDTEDAGEVTERLPELSFEEELATTQCPCFWCLNGFNNPAHSFGCQCDECQEAIDGIPEGYLSEDACDWEDMEDSGKITKKLHTPEHCDLCEMDRQYEHWMTYRIAFPVLQIPQYAESLSEVCADEDAYTCEWVGDDGGYAIVHGTHKIYVYIGAQIVDCLADLDD